MNRAAVSLILLVTGSIYCVPQKSNTDSSKSAPSFEVEYEWSSINFTWESENIYKKAIESGRYVPGNSAPAGIKFYKNKAYIALPRICEGTPVTLGYINQDENTPRKDPLITPYPDWDTNDLSEITTCDNKLENVQSMEIDADGILWVIDGFRREASNCPPKLILYDLNNNGKIVLSYNFSNEICLGKGGFLNDLVVDASDGGFAYITDHSSIDPGIVVYSKAKNKAWKLRDASMFAEPNAANFEVGNKTVSVLSPLDGIALQPASASPRNLYYCSLVGYGLYSISTDILKDESVINSGNWRRDVKFVGPKQAQTDGMVVDNTGVLYYGLLPLYGVGKWDTNQDFSKAEIVYQNNSTMIWTDSFGFDDKGYLYLLANHINDYFGSKCKPEAPSGMFRILKFFTGTQSYLY